ncbi:DUF4011 domain-containing protein [Acetobacteraceae bacterium]|nr:DUF4011 domain-containing protein [Acetobacteraceae bacterium]
MLEEAQVTETPEEEEQEESASIPYTQTDALNAVKAWYIGGYSLNAIRRELEKINRPDVAERLGVRLGDYLSRLCTETEREERRENKQLIRLSNPDGYRTTKKKNTSKRTPTDKALLKTHPFTLKALFNNPFSLAYYLNHRPSLLSLDITNLTEKNFTNLSIELSAYPALLEKKVWHLSALNAHSTYQIQTSKESLSIDLKSLLEKTEATLVEISILVKNNDENILFTQKENLKILAFDEWGGCAHEPVLLSTFVTPNADSVNAILKKAASILGENKITHGLIAYQRDKQAVWDQAQAIWRALCQEEIYYASPKASFVQNGQRVRLPDQILREGLATCLDTSLLLASCLEQAGLHPVILMTNNHAFTGVWLEKTQAPTAIWKDILAIRNHVKAKNLIVFETTNLCRPSPADFHLANENAEETLSKLNDTAFTSDEAKIFEYALDISLSRQEGILPFPSEREITSIENPLRKTLENTLFQNWSTPTFSENTYFETTENSLSRFGEWTKKLLDFSSKNRLIKLPKKSTNKTTYLYSPDLNLLAEKLRKTEKNSSKKLDHLCFAVWPERQAGSPNLLENEAEKKNFALHNLDKQNNLILEELSANKMENRLTQMRYDAQSALREGGANILWLTIGGIKWKEENARYSDPFEAPLILWPVMLSRPNGRSPSELRMREEDVAFNTTIGEYLQKAFNLNFTPSLDLLEKIQTGETSLTAFLGGLRQKIAQEGISGFEITETVTLSILDFESFYLWTDLKNREESILKHPLVQQLLKKQADFPSDDEAEHRRNFETAERLAGAKLDDLLQNTTLFCPLPADSSQLLAVKRAASGESFVLIGPPGTGKSQTIANIIADRLHAGKKILFVAAKQTALSVVHQRLQKLGLGSACLDLFSQKANKKEIVTHLASTTEISLHRPQEENNALSLLEEKQNIVSKLNALTKSVHEKENGQWSFYQAAGERLRAQRLKTPDISLGADFSLNDFPLAERLDALEDLIQKWEDVAPEAQKDFTYLSLKHYIFATEERLRDLLPILITEWKHAEELIKKISQTAGISFSFVSLQAFSLLKEILQARLLPEISLWCFSERAEKIPAAFTALEAAQIKKREAKESLDNCTQALKTWQAAHKFKNFLAQKNLKKNVTLSDLHLKEEEAQRLFETAEESWNEKYTKILRLLHTHPDLQKQLFNTEDPTEIALNLKSFKVSSAQISLLNQSFQAFQKLESLTQQVILAKMSALPQSFKIQLKNISPLNERLKNLLSSYQIHLLKLLPLIEEVEKETETSLSTLKIQNGSWLEKIPNIFARWHKSLPHLREWTAYQRSILQAERLQVGHFAHLLQKNEIASKDLKKAFKKSLCNKNSK